MLKRNNCVAVTRERRIVAPTKMKPPRSAWLVGGLALLLSVAGAAAQGTFQNLDFELATVTPAPADYTPWDAYQPISAADALPYWTVREDATVCTAIWGAPNALDETSVALVTAGSYPAYPALQGVYSVQFYAWADAGSPFFRSASISQTGLVPNGMHSIQFLVQSPPVAGGRVQASPSVTLNGTPINIFPISTSSGVVTMAGDISAFAGLTANLDIQCAGTSGATFYLSENIFALDAIQFSNLSVPEPGVFGLSAFGALLVGWRFLWQQRCRGN